MVIGHPSRAAAAGCRTSVVVITHPAAERRQIVASGASPRTIGRTDDAPDYNVASSFGTEGEPGRIGIHRESARE
jgi:hypothetical protein